MAKRVDVRKKQKAWCFTSYDDSEPVFKQETAYYCFGRETCPTTARKHWQGYVVFTNRKRLSEIKSKEGVKWHFEAARGTVAENIGYTKKDGEWKEVGVRPSEKTARATEANSRKWIDMRRAAEQGRFDGIESSCYIRYFRNLHGIYEYTQNRRVVHDLPEGSICGIWISGPPGVGKSHFIRSFVSRFFSRDLLGVPGGGECGVQPNADSGNGNVRAERGDCCYNKDRTRWWPGFAFQPAVIIDDIDHSCKWMGNYLKIWADRYAFTAEQKGGGLKIRPRLIAVTSNYSISDIWTDDGQLHLAINRRFECINVDTRDDFDIEGCLTRMTDLTKYCEILPCGLENLKQEVVDLTGEDD